MKRKIIYGLLAVLISFGLWLYVVTVVNPEWEDTFYNIPVVLENEEILLERGLMLMSEEEPKVTLRLSGNRTDMIKLNSSNITIRADLSRIPGAGDQPLSYTIVYPGDVPSNAFEIISQTPQQLTLKVVERKSKPVDVELVTNEPDDGYKLIESVYDNKITVSGPADVIDRIVKAEITVDLTGHKQPIAKDYDYVLLDEDGNAVESEWIKATPEKINCTLKIQKAQDVAVAVEVLNGAGLTAKDYSVTYYNQETNAIIEKPITISGAESQLAEMQNKGLLQDGKLFFDKKIDLAQIPGTPTADGGLEIVMENLSLDDLLAPYEISNHSGVNMVKVVVKVPKPGSSGVMAIKEINITNIIGENVPANMKVNMTTQSVKVIVRGPSYELDWIEAKDLTLVVDFANAIANGKNEEFAAKVILNMANRKESAVVGTYKVEATVTSA